MTFTLQVRDAGPNGKKWRCLKPTKLPRHAGPAAGGATGSISGRVPLNAGNIGVPVGRLPGLLAFPQHGPKTFHDLVMGGM